MENMAELRTIKGKQQEMFENNDRFYNQVREEHREMAKEIQQVKNYQVNQTMVESARNKALMEELAATRAKLAWEGNSGRQEASNEHRHNGFKFSPQKYENDQALMKIREQHANFFEVQRQLNEWMSTALATVISDLFAVGIIEWLMNSAHPLANGVRSCLFNWIG
ncbi:hypothetical protein PIB30_090627 [Stylosanthes scabra]|uniref:Uncharacterized protein n=1 Tax=Stylosanthes scabra TaxID=79078 RepID=A0ABU6UT27_9FABA|nr:hypothetical protein [Stylosanthes scabra]